MSAKAKGKPAAKAAKRQKLTAELRQLEREEQLAAHANEACERLDNAACAWAAAMRFRLGEMIDACYAVIACAIDPDCTGPMCGSLHLKTIFDLSRLDAFTNTLERAEKEFNKLLLPATAAEIPNLPAAIRDADDAIAGQYDIRRMPRPGAPEART